MGENKRYKVKLYVSKGLSDILVCETEIENITTERIELNTIGKFKPFSDDAYLMIDISEIDISENE